MEKAVSKAVSNFGTTPYADRRQDLAGGKSAGKAAIGLDFKKAGSGLAAVLPSVGRERQHWVQAGPIGGYESDPR